MLLTKDWFWQQNWAFQTGCEQVSISPPSPLKWSHIFYGDVRQPATALQREEMRAGVWKQLWAYLFLSLQKWHTLIKNVGKVMPVGVDIKPHSGGGGWLCYAEQRTYKSKTHKWFCRYESTTDWCNVILLQTRSIQYWLSERDLNLGPVCCLGWAASCDQLVHQRSQWHFLISFFFWPDVIWEEATKGAFIMAYLTI